MNPLFEPASYSGLFAIIVATGAGLPLPEDAAVIAGGYLVHRGVTRLLPTVVVALVAVLCGDSLLYFAGLRLGPRVVRHRLFARLLSASRMARAERFFARHGVVAVLLGRFVMGLRAALFVTAGTLRMSYARFLFINLLGALVSVPVLVWLGARGGEQLDRLSSSVAVVRWSALLVLVCAVLVIAVVRHGARRRSAQAGSEPE